MDEDKTLVEGQDGGTPEGADLPTSDQPQEEGQDVQPETQAPEPETVEKKIEFTPHGETDPEFNCVPCKGEGLLDQYTVCSNCKGTGKV